MNSKSTIVPVLLSFLISYSTYSLADSQDASDQAPATASTEEDTSQATTATDESKQEAPAAPVAEESTESSVQEVVSAPAPEVVAEAPAPVAAPDVAEPAPAFVPATEVAVEAPPQVPNPYSNMSDAEFALLQRLAGQLSAQAQLGTENAQAQAHSGRYGEDSFVSMGQSFSEAAGTLKETLWTAPVDIRKVHMSVKALKTLVLDIDDVFVYNQGYLNQIRNWNECKRILRQIDGLIYREGGLRRAERIWDSNQFLKDIGKFLNVHGVLSGVDDQLHRSNPTAPMDTLVGRQGGGRRTAHVWTIPSQTYHGQLANNRSEFNEAVSQY